MAEIIQETNTPEALVDIRTVTADKDLPKEARIAAFVRQIKNPYRFRCGDFIGCPMRATAPVRATA